VDIHNGVTRIGAWAFRDCYALQSIDIPESVTEIGESVFFECSSLQSVDIPSSVTTIGERAFGDCKALQSIHIHSTTLENLDVAKNAFSYVKASKCTLYVPTGTKEAYSNHRVFGKFKKIVEE
jgi:hypothetical protein